MRRSRRMIHVRIWHGDGLGEAHIDIRRAGAGGFRRNRPRGAALPHSSTEPAANASGAEDDKQPMAGRPFQPVLSACLMVWIIAPTVRQPTWGGHRLLPCRTNCSSCSGIVGMYVNSLHLGVVLRD